MATRSSPPPTSRTARLIACCAVEGLDAAGLLRRPDALALCSKSPGEVTRLFLTRQHARIGLDAAGRPGTTVDAWATLIGRLPGVRPEAPTPMLGSPIDAVRNAGRFDGCLGVALAIAAAAHFGAHTLPCRLEIRAVGNEEGVCFPVTFTGAHPDRHAALSRRLQPSS